MNSISHTVTYLSNKLGQISLCLFVLGLTLTSQTAIYGNQPPNILIVLADDLGYGDVGCYNKDSRIPTPHIDKLAKQGMRFTDAHSPSTVCTPTRYSIMTGDMAFRLNFRGVFDGAGGPCLIKKDQLTLPEMLKNKGYTTAMFGKWHIGLTFKDQNDQPICKNGLKAVKQIDFTKPIIDAPIHRGFDHFFGTACCPTTDWLYAYIHGDRVEIPPTSIVDKLTVPHHEWSFDMRPGLVADDFDFEEVDLVFLNKSLKFLEDHHRMSPDKPFFLFHSMQAVHLPSFPAEQFKGKTQAGPHGDFIFECDYVVGQLMQKLKELNLDENTLIIFTSDNGPEVGTVHNMRKLHTHDGAKPWRGMKRDNWEGGHRVPFITRWPAKVKPDTTCEQTICLTDIMATCAELTKTQLPHKAAVDSFSMLPLFLGVTEKPIREFTLHQTISLALAIRKGEWKYLDHQGSGGNNYAKSKVLKEYALPDSAPNAPGQLYNLARDPGETENLYLKHPKIVKELKSLLETCKTSGRSRP